MTDCTPMGCRAFIGLTWFMGQNHLAGDSWGGCFSITDLMISVNWLLLIACPPRKKATGKNIQKDATALMSQLAPLFKINGKFPPYFLQIQHALENLPLEVARDPVKLYAFYDKFVNLSGFASPEKNHYLLESFHINQRNLHVDQMSYVHSDRIPNFMGKARTDCLLEHVLNASNHPLFRGFVTEVANLRHVYGHSTDPVARLSGFEKLFPLKERDMLAALYQEHTLPDLVDVLFKEMEKDERKRKQWLIEVLNLYKRQKFELGAMPIGVICFESEPNELLLSSVVKSLCHLKDFCEMQSHSHIGNPCAVCALDSFVVSIRKESKNQEKCLFDLRIALTELHPESNIEKKLNDPYDLVETIFQFLQPCGKSDVTCNVLQPDDKSCITHQNLGLRVLKIKCPGSYEDCLKNVNLNDKNSVDANVPRILAVVLEPEGHEISGSTSAFACVNTQLCISSCCPGLKGSKHSLLSGVCYRRGRYVRFVREDGLWSLYDDEIVETVGSWEELAKLCENCGFQPGVLFFETDD